MKLLPLFLSATLAISLTPAITHAQSTRAAREARKTAAAVKAVDDHWGEAEVHGDTAYLNQLLLPGYRSIDAKGASHPKSRIVAGAAKINSPAAVAKAVADSAAYATTHLSGVSVLLQDNVAVLSFYSKALGPDNGVRGSDVFIYTGGHWHAIYSQHSSAQ
jgi:hypothetical protein